MFNIKQPVSVTLCFSIRRMKYSLKLRSRTSPPRRCSWRKCLWSRPWCTMLQSSTRSQKGTKGNKVFMSSLLMVEFYTWGDPQLQPFLCRESTFGKMSYLQPMDTRQYLYCLKPKPEYAEKAGVIKGVTVIGKLDIVWKTNLGERGRLQTSQLQRMVFQSALFCHISLFSSSFMNTFNPVWSPYVLQAPGYGDIRLSLDMIPDTVNLEEPFDIICKITNCRWKSPPNKKSHTEYKIQYY